MRYCVKGVLKNKITCCVELEMELERAVKSPIFFSDKLIKANHISLNMIFLKIYITYVYFEV